MRRKIKIILSLSILISIISLAQYVNATSKYDVAVGEKFSPIELYGKIPKNNEGLNEYKKAVKTKNDILKEKKVKDIISTITFNEPLNFDDFRSFLLRNNIIEINQVNGRIIDQNGERITFAVRYSDDKK